MKKTIAAVLAGLLIGTGATYFLFATGKVNPGQQQAEIIRDIVDAPKMSVAAAEQHRETRYQDLQTIAQIYELPTAFARSEALYTLAGRSDSAVLQGLLFDANRIADTLDRQVALNTLFFRLSELDPRSALELARMDYFKSEKTLEQIVWRTWAKADLDDAIFAAKTQTTRAHSNTAAQALFSVFGYMGNTTTDRIETELGIGPDRSTRSRFLYRMADRSPAEAIAYINDMPEGSNQAEFVSWLAYYLSLSDTTVALTYAEQFDSANYRTRYRNIVAGNAARENPRSTVERLLATGKTGRRNSEFHRAVTALTESDIELSMQYFEQLSSAEDKQIFGAAIANQLARKDTSQALAWARANEGVEYPYLEMAVLGRIAQTDPQLAIAEAQSVDNTAFRSQLIDNVISGMAHQNPVEALSYLNQIENKQQREQAEMQLASTWIRQDPDAAIEWILSNDEEKAGRILSSSGWQIMRSDLDVAIRLLPTLNEVQQVNWRQQIAQQLVTRRSITDAQSFVRQFEGQDGYSQLQASVISGVAQKDPMRAKLMADQLADADARDTAYAQIIGQRAQTNPIEALSWLRNISDDHHRSMATAQLAHHWYSNDPEGAYRWVRGLQRGQLRDDAIMHMSGLWRTPTSEQDAMIDSISDADKRGQARVRQVYNVMQSNPARALEMLENTDIPNYQRQQIEASLRQYRSRR